MYNTNIVVISGNVTADPELRQTKDGTFVARFKVAVNRGDRADFLPCTAFGKTAEVINKNCAQGKKIAVNGRIQTGSYTKQDGTTVYTTDVIVEYMEFAESKAASSGGGQSGDWQNIPEDLDDEALPFK